MGRRVVISLDPEYVPWENTDDSIVRLRRKKRPGVAIAFALLVPVVIAVAVFILPELQQTDSAPPPVETVEVEVADGQPTPDATVPPTATPDLFAGRAGSLGLRFGDQSISFFPCNQYTVTVGAALPQRGDTRGGPVIIVERYPVEVWCDTGVWILEE